MGFKFDIEKVKSLPNFSDEVSKKLRVEYDRDSELENHSFFTPTIPGWESNTVSYDISGYKISDTINNKDLAEVRSSKIAVGFKVPWSGARLSYS